MTIGFDGSRIAKDFHTGTEHYSTEILKALFKIDYQNQYIIYSPKLLTNRLGELPKNFKYRIIPFGRFWTQIRLSWEMAFNKQPDLLFVPSHTIPLVHPKKTIATIHDLAFKYYPELFGKSELYYQEFGLNMAVKKAAHIITVSENTKKDIVKLCHVKPEKITVIYHGYDQNLYKPLTPEEIVRNQKLKEKSVYTSKILGLKPYIFFIGRIEKKKNILNLLKSYVFLRKEPKIKHKLVLAGKPGYGYEEIKSYINSLPDAIKKDIIELGYVENTKLSSWMKNADIFFFPTLFEGFGLPVVEAMASGVPVVASNTTSIPEIAGSAAVLVNPHKVYDMAVALSKIINNQKFRYSLISKGKTRASMFTWQKSAEKTLKVFEQVIKE